mmetsp:Transcript_39504/g.106001  ORF Transcript_39504/g.106001 Transcript_39504/m.106001 type:complete len:368 (-) Transcript_39504:371-1474(-)
MARVRALLALALPSALGSGSGTPTFYSGYLVDFYCFSLCNIGGVSVDGSNVITGPEEHTLHCLRDVPQCRDGYFLAELTAGGEYRIKFTLDEHSQEAALGFIDSFPKGSIQDHAPLTVTVQGYHSQEDGVLRGAVFTACSNITECDGYCAGSCDTPAEQDFSLKPRLLLVGHVVCMCLSWGCLLPLGVIWAHYLRQNQWKPGGVPLWFQGHRWLMSVGVLLQLLGFVFIILWKKAAHFRLPHEIIGLVVVVLGCLQPLNAQMRHLKAVGHPDHPGPWRRAWELWHKGSGYAAVALGLANVVLGPIHAARMRFGSGLPAASGAFVGVSLGAQLLGVAVLQARRTLGASRGLGPKRAEGAPPAASPQRL